MTSDPQRTIDQVEQILIHAKLTRDEVNSTSQCISLEPHMDSTAFILMEMDDHILKTIEGGESVIVRGEKTDSAVVCTPEKTYDIKEAETSNTLLLIPDVSFPEDLTEKGDTKLKHIQVCAIKHDYYELKPILPRLQRLHELLLENPFSGREVEDDEDHQGKKYSLSELVDQVQASEAEVFNGFKKIGACLIEGYWRLLDFDFLGKVLNSLLSLKDENDWSLDAIPLIQCCDTLQDLYPRSVIDHTLKHFSENTSEDSMETEHTDDIYRLSEDKICRYFGELLLKAAGTFHLEDFENTWQLSVPEGMKTGMYMLGDLALVDRDSTPQVIKYFPVSDLPENVNERFDRLFEAKEKWTMDEVSPYIKDLATAKTGVGSLLLKNARASTQNGIKMYSSRKPKS